MRALISLLTPAVRDLMNSSFEHISVTLEWERDTIILQAAHNQDGLTLSSSHTQIPLFFPALGREPHEPSERYNERELEFYREQEALNARHPVMEIIRRIPTPMFLDLERRAQVGVRRRSSSFATARHYVRSPTLLSGSLLDSLRDAQSLAEDAYRHLQSLQHEAANKLKADLILTAFAIPEASETPSLRAPSKAILKEVERNRTLVNDLLPALDLPPEAIDQTVTPFFDRLQEILASLAGGSGKTLLTGDPAQLNLVSRWLSMQPQLDRINHVVRIVEEYNKKIQQDFSPIRHYLDLVNRFLYDSGKELRFSRTLSLVVAIENTEEERPITSLSSGERQLVVILTHLAFNAAARRANVLIIDEPELSLHIRWQEIFVDALRGASENLQIILATHSPSIIMDRVDKCVDIMEARS